MNLYDDARPIVRFDGLEIVFHSNRPEGVAGWFDIWAAWRPSMLPPGHLQ